MWLDLFVELTTEKKQNNIDCFCFDEFQFVEEKIDLNVKSPQSSDLFVELY